MTQEEKQLLLIGLCARLPYGVMIEITSDGGMVEASYDMRLDAGLLADLLHSEDNFKPYLRSMSSMTEGEYKEFCKISGLFKKEDGNYFSNHLSEWGNSIITERVMVRTIDWLNTHHFDYRGLITMGLALEAPEGMYKIESL